MKDSDSEEYEKKEAEIEDVDIAVIGRLVSSGNRFYVSIPSSSILFYELRAKDLVHLKIDKVKKRVRPIYVGKEE